MAELMESVANMTNQLSLGDKWARNALREHASVASFAAFSIALMTNPAPSNLVEDSLKAALGEVHHAKTSFAIASKLLGKDVSPGPLPPSNHQFNSDLTALSMSVAKEGCADSLAPSGGLLSRFMDWSHQKMLRLEPCFLSIPA